MRLISIFSLLILSAVGLFVIITVNKVKQTKSLDVDVYYQMMCSDSIWFIRHQLWPTLNPTNLNINLRLFAYGHTKEKREENGTYSYSCSWGLLECQLNTISTCVGHLYKNKELDYVYCALKYVSLQGAQKCADHLALDWKMIKNCSEGDLGNRLQHEMGKRTPRNKFVPHIVINGRAGNSTEQKQYFKEFKKSLCFYHMIEGC